jgi:formylglycine-generating enzyme required for sulfatase activity
LNVESGGIDMNHEVEKMNCCTPSAGRKSAAANRPVFDLEAAANPTSHESLVDLPCGSFLMGTDYPLAFPDDGEGPVRTVTLDPFKINRFPVTNDRFHKFVIETGYKTEAERFGWSFVFWAHIPAAHRAELIEKTVAAAPWWCVVREASWIAPEGPGSNIDARWDHPVVHVSWNDAQAYARWAFVHYLAGIVRT